MASHEPDVQTGQLPPAELGRRAYETITGIATNLLATPEFMTALHRTFFGRSFENNGRPSIADGVYFTKEGTGFRVMYRGEPLRFGPEEQRDYTPKISLTVGKYDTGLHPTELAALTLSSRFVEDQNGRIREFTGGGIHVREHVGYTGGLVPEHERDFTNTEEAFYSIRRLFEDLSPSVTL